MAAPSNDKTTHAVYEGICVQALNYVDEDRTCGQTSEIHTISLGLAPPASN